MLVTTFRYLPRVISMIVFVLLVDGVLCENRTSSLDFSTEPHDFQVRTGRRLNVVDRPATMGTVPAAGGCLRGAGWVAKHVTVDMTSADTFDQDILAFRAAVEAAVSVNAKNNLCYPTTGWIITIRPPKPAIDPVSIEMSDNLYIHINECAGAPAADRADAVNAANMYEKEKGAHQGMLLFNRDRLNCAIQQKGEEGADADVDGKRRCCVFFISEAVRFDWMRFRMKEILGMPKGFANNYGFRFDPKRVVLEWGTFSLALGVSESQTRTLLGMDDGTYSRKGQPPFTIAPNQINKKTEWIKDNEALSVAEFLEAGLPDYFEDNGDSVTIPDDERAT